MYENPIPSTSKASDSFDQVSDSARLEQILNDESNDDNISEDDDLGEFMVLGSGPNVTWQPPKRAFKWFKKIADIELKDDKMDSIKNDYTPPESEAHHFVPPKLPATLWDSIKSSPADLYKHRICLRAQSLSYTAVMPMLSVLESIDPSDTENRNKLTTAIQLICSSNLQLNRFRRSMVSPFLKKDLRKSLLSHPVTHDNLFGQDFDKCTDKAIKEQSATQKILHTKSYNHASQPSTSSVQKPKAETSSKYPSKFRNVTTYNYKNPNYEPINQGHQSFRSTRGRGRGRFRGYTNQRRSRN